MNHETLKFFCQHCGQKVSARQEQAGQQFACPSCRGLLVVGGHHNPSTLIDDKPGKPSRKLPLIKKFIAGATLSLCALVLLFPLGKDEIAGSGSGAIVRSRAMGPHFILVQPESRDWGSRGMVNIDYGRILVVLGAICAVGGAAWALAGKKR